LSWLVSSNVMIMAERKNVYSVLSYFAYSLGCGWQFEEDSSAVRMTKGDRAQRVVGIHPIAGQPSREWCAKKWNALLESIVNQGWRAVIFGPLTEARRLEEEFGGWRHESAVSIATGEVRTFLESLKEIDAFVGLDSFGIHAAYAQGLPAVMINGSNDPEAWAPPGAQVVGDGGGCKDYPCFNRPRCHGQKYEYICIKSVTVDSVFSALKKVVGN